MMALGMTKDITIVPEGDMNVCTKFHGNPLNGRQNISLKVKYVNLTVALQKM